MVRSTVLHGARMSFLGGLFGKKKSASSPAREKADANPADPRLQMDAAVQLKAAGDLSTAVEYAQRSAKAHRDAGFAQRALAALKTAAQWAPDSAAVLEDLGSVYLELKHKEDARQVFLQLRRLYSGSGQSSEVTRVDAMLRELGPGR